MSPVSSAGQQSVFRQFLKPNLIYFEKELVVCTMEVHPTLTNCVLLICMEAALAARVKEKHTHTPTHTKRSTGQWAHIHTPALTSFTVNTNQFYPKWHIMELTICMPSVLEIQQNSISTFVKLLFLVTARIFQPYCIFVLL